VSVFYFNRMPVSGPWGGGNKTLTSLAARLQEMGHTVTGEPRSDIDVIFCVDPRQSPTGVTYQDLFSYAAAKKIPIIQRVGDVGTHGKPDLTYLVRMSTALSDRVIFTSEWARDYIGCVRESTVIPNGALPIFFSKRRDDRQCSERPRIVTHHWSNNPMKGLSVYETLLSAVEKGQIDVDFTYIGRSSDALASVTVPPVDADKLAVSLPEHDIYLSASLWEAGANHILEAMACGLPVIYSRDGGSIPEYCSGRGIAFGSSDEIITAVQRVVADYRSFREQSLSYTRTIDDVVDQYVEVLCAE